jgi:glycosyltransferase involved in cell wall biosynthesis
VIRSSIAVSVVIPTHDRRKLLLKTLASVLGQRRIGLEVLVVDDGSTDRTADAVRALNDPRVRLLRNEQSKGVAAARNMGAAAAAGSWIALLDDDDLWAPDKLIRQIHVADESSRDWVYGGVVEIDEDDRLLGGRPPLAPEELVGALKERNLMPAGCSNVVVRADVLTEAGSFDPRLRHLADWDLWLRLARRGPPACAPWPLVAYRIHAAQASLDPTGMLAEARVLERRHGVQRASIYRWLAWTQLRQGHRVKAIRAYAGAVRAGDGRSLARAAVAALHPRPTRVRSRRPRPPHAAEWQSSALEWLKMIR